MLSGFSTYPSGHADPLGYVASGCDWVAVGAVVFTVVAAGAVSFAGVLVGFGVAVGVGASVGVGVTVGIVVGATVGMLVGFNVGVGVGVTVGALVVSIGSDISTTAAVATETAVFCVDALLLQAVIAIKENTRTIGIINFFITYAPYHIFTFTVYCNIRLVKSA